MILITLLLLVIALITLFKLYGLRFFLNPATSFVFIWIISVLSLAFFLAFIPGTAGVEIYPEYIDELLGYISFTAISVVIVNLLTYKRIKIFKISWAPNIALTRNLQILIMFSFIASLVNFLSIGTLNFNEIRSGYLENSELLSGGKRSLGIFEYANNLLTIFNIPLLILTSISIGVQISLSKTYSKIKYIYFLPLISGILTGLSSGGRHGIIDTLYIAFIFMIIGIFKIDQKRHFIAQQIKKLGKYAIITLMVFSIFTTFIDTQRKTRTSVNFSEYPLLKPFSGLMTYLVAHYAGYQLHRYYSTTNELEPGRKTLQGITFFEIPFLSRIVGTPTSLSALLELHESDKANKSQFDEMYLGWENTTATVYIGVYDDFGYLWTFAVILLFVILSQIIFIKFINSPTKSFISVFPYYLVLFLWFNSIFSSEIFGNWIGNKLLAFLIIHLMVRSIKQKVNIIPNTGVSQVSM